MKMNSELSIILTPRDTFILKDLYNSTVLSLFQIRNKHFANLSKPTALNRLTKLEKGGFIKRNRVPRFVLSSKDLQVSVVFQITKDGISELQKRTNFEMLKHDPVSLSPFSIEHDLLLNEVMDKLSFMFPQTNIVNGKLLKPDSNQNGINPDAVMIWKDGKQYAVELELTLKSEQRYRELILKYRTQSHFEKVIYVTQNKAIETKLVELMAHKTLSNGERPITDMFHFVCLDDLLNAQVCPKITNGETLISPERS